MLEQRPDRRRNRAIPSLPPYHTISIIQYHSSLAAAATFDFTMCCTPLTRHPLVYHPCFPSAHTSRTTRLQPVQTLDLIRSFSRGNLLTEATPTRSRNSRRKLQQPIFIVSVYPLHSCTGAFDRSISSALH